MLSLNDFLDEVGDDLEEDFIDEDFDDMDEFNDVSDF